jgi:acyl-homoserine-lactone acylase
VVAVSDSAADSAVSGKGGAPAVLAAKPAPEMDEQEKLQLAAYARTTVNPTDKGSNGVAIGGELGSGEGGLLYTNPHISWTDFGFRMWALHQIIPGVTNMLGANQANRAHVGFGTNGNIAWTNTVSTAEGYMFYKLDLVPGNPMAYLFDAQERQIEPVEVTVPVKDDSGAVTEQSHTFYRSHFGYMLGGRFPWLTTLAFTIRFAEEGPRAMQGGALAYSRATTVRELKEAMNQYQTTPKITTIAADRSGEAMFGDLGPMVNFTDQQLQDCLFSSPVYLGNSSACEWNNDEDAAAPGLLGPSKQPFIYRQDYVTNSNDSYWLANPEQPLTGFPRVVGDVETERTMRTRSGLLMVQERQQGVDGLPGNTFDLDLLIDRMLSNQNMAARLLNDDLVTLCEANPSVTVDDASVDISEACPILAAWDRSANLDSRGEHLFREFMRAVRTEDDGPGAVPAAVKPQVLFDVNDPVNTPAGMDDTDNPASLQALAMAVQVLRDAGIALDARLGDLQSITRNGTPIPLHGGEQMEGIFNKMSMDFAGSEGYPDVTGSSASWVMATHVAGDNTRVKGLTAYSQSSDPTSEHYADMTERFSAKDLVDIPFLPEDVEAAAISTMNLEEGTAQCADGGWQNFEALGFADEAACRDYFVELYDNRITGFVDD